MPCISAGKFSNEYTAAYPGKGMAESHRKYGNTSIFLNIGVHFISDKEPTEEFFSAFQALHNADHRIVITSDRSPRGMPQLDIILRSRFKRRLIVHIQPPDTNNVN